MGFTAPPREVERRDPSAAMSALLEPDEPGRDLVRRSVYVAILAVLAAFWGTIGYLVLTLVS